MAEGNWPTCYFGRAGVRRHVTLHGHLLPGSPVGARRRGVQTAEQEALPPPRTRSPLCNQFIRGHAMQ